MIILFFLIQSVFAHNKVGNGGGGVKVAPGVYSLFSSSEMSADFETVGNFAVNEVSNCADRLFVSIKSDIRRMQAFLPLQATAFFNSNLCPSGRSRYSDVYDGYLYNHVVTSKINRLTKLYSLVTNIPKDKIAIFAFSDPNKQKTYIFPEFYNLTFNDKKIILFHELFWLYKYPYGAPAISPKDEIKLYEKMLILEKSLIDFLIEPQNHLRQVTLANNLKSFKED